MPKFFIKKRQKAVELKNKSPNNIDTNLESSSNSLLEKATGQENPS